MQRLKRIPELDALRGFSALSVLLFHLTCTFRELFPEQSWHPMFTLREGHLGVELFFIISGFVIFLSLEQTKNLLSFWISRVSRLYPAYWASVFVGAAALHFLPGWQEKISVTELLVNLSMFQDLPHRGIPHVQAVYWTLSCEMNFYLLVSVLFLTGVLKKFDVLLLLSVLFSMFYHLTAARQDVSAFHPLYFYFLIDNNLLLFLLGMSFYLAYKHPESKAIFFRVPLLLAAYAYAHDLTRSVAVCCFCLLFFLLIHERLTWLRLKVPEWLGKISYSLYLMHQNLMYALLFVVISHGQFTAYTPLAVVALLFLVAFVSYYLFEKGASRWLKKGLQKSFARFL
jgi:peptidoglycan/LPS O-acetylase OafA/YrhL